MRRLLFLFILCLLLMPLTGTANHVECSDGVDNDGDGAVDFSADTGCESYEDDSENTGGTVRGSSSSRARSSVRPRSSSASSLAARSIAASSASVVPYTPLGTSSSKSASSLRPFSSSSRMMLLTKAADRREVLEGGTIAYTIRVHNVLLQTMRDVTVSDHFDYLLADLKSAGDARVGDDGVLEWIIPTLAPGQVWERSYTLTLKNDTAGTILKNIANLNGRNIAEVPLNEKLYVVEVPVIEGLPETGYGYELLAVLAGVMAAVGAVRLQRRLA